MVTKADFGSVTAHDSTILEYRVHQCFSSHPGRPRPRHRGSCGAWTVCKACTPGIINVEHTGVA